MTDLHFDRPFPPLILPEIKTNGCHNDSISGFDLELAIASGM